MKKLLAVLTVCTMFLCAAASCGSGSSYGGDPAKAIQGNASESSSIIGRWEADDETLRNASEGKAVSVKKCILEFTEDGKYIVDSETDSSDLLCIKDDGIYIKGRKADQYTYNGKTLTVGDLILERVDTVEASSLYGRYKRADNSDDYIYDFESSGVGVIIRHRVAEYEYHDDRKIITYRYEGGENQFLTVEIDGDTLKETTNGITENYTRIS